jgi:AraC-like DNA-binding protein
MAAEFVPVKLAKSILRVVDAQGYDVDLVVRHVGLGFNPLQETHYPDTIAAQLYNRLYNHVMWLIQDEALGLQLNEKVPAGSFRIMCMLIIHCENLERALLRAAEFNAFCRNLTGMPPQDYEPVTVKGDIAACHIPDNRPLIDSTNLMGIAHAMSIWRRLASWLIGRNIETLGVQFTQAQPANMAPLQELFQCPIEFEQQIAGFSFATNYLHAPLIHTEESLREFLRAAPFELLVKTDDNNDDLLGKMRRLVGSDFSREFPSVTTMADAMNMSVRTLRRRLEKEGLTYQQFKDKARTNAAMQYLNRPELKINAVAALMGFDEPSAFHRSFKKWTGITPGDYRGRCQDF